MTIWEKLLLPDSYSRLSLREWMLGATPTGKSLVRQGMRKFVCKGIIENRPKDIFWLEERATNGDELNYNDIIGEIEKACRGAKITVLKDGRVLEIDHNFDPATVKEVKPREEEK